jgi:hypothetical protein
MLTSLDKTDSTVQVRTRHQIKMKSQLVGSLSYYNFSKLHRDGYIILRNAIKIEKELVDQIVTCARRPRGSTIIFNNPAKNDGARRQFPISPVNAVEKVLEDLFPEKNQSDW